ncbi:MAG: exodeoxyribonuclease VII small subunit [Gemmatimonadetes bacterium]|nr:exodeoxyribonuclease VII small subunit [Gemmatimonadota bacterium]
MNGPEREAGAPDAGLETRLKRLEQIVSALEMDDLELERALALFEEGVAHVRAAEKILAQAELKVEELLQGDRTRPIETPEQ